MTNPQPTWPTVDRGTTDQAPAAPAETAPPSNGPIVTLGIAAAIGLIFGTLIMTQGGSLSALIFGGVLILCGAMALTGALVASHIGARM